MNTLEPKIYVACLAAYNNGYLHGKWIAANQDMDSLYNEIKKMLETSPIPNAKEFAIHDYSDFGDMIIDEHDSLKRVIALANFITQHDELGLAVLNNFNGDLEYTCRALEENYHGIYNSEEDFACYWISEVMCIEMPECLKNYIDYKAIAYDFFINDFFSIKINNKIHVFSNF